MATLTEIRKSWSIHDVMDYNELLDLRQESDLKMAEHRMEQEQHRAMQRQLKG